MTNLISKDYIEREYAQAIREYECAKNEDEQWEARKTMSRLEGIALQEFGFDYSDSDKLEKLKEKIKR